ncbi:MAG: phosphate ABC transporter permease subunit PstC, partial [Clostridia bacterium]
MQRKWKEEAMRWVFCATACACILAVMLICGFLLANGLPFFGKVNLWSFLTGQKWKPTNDIYGILPMILGSIYVTGGALALGAPIAILTAVFLVRFCPQGLYRVLKPAVALLAGIPSVVYGFFGLTAIVPFVKDTFGGNGNSMLTACILLAMMILPTMIQVAESAIRSVPENYYEGSLALGATKEASVFRTVIPAAKSGILAAMILGVGRAVGETMAV